MRRRCRLMTLPDMRLGGIHQTRRRVLPIKLIDLQAEMFDDRRPERNISCKRHVGGKTVHKIPGQKRIAVPRRQRSITSKSTGGSTVSTPFSLRAELKGVEVAPGVTLRYWEAGAGRVLVMLPGLGHAASLYKYQLEGLFG
jgi:hypothetical protein